MEIRLTQKPQNPIIIEGFPGIGLIGTITTEYLIKHLDAKPIGSIWSERISPIAAVHGSKIVQPLEIFWSKKKNIVVLHAMTDVKGLEWEISDHLEKLYKQLKAKEIISIEGIMGETPNTKTYFFSNIPASTKKLHSLGAEALKEGIIMGVTAAILLKGKSMKTTGIFVETNSKLPDSRSSAAIMEVLSAYLKLGIDSKPLIKAAQDFENNLKGYMEKLKSAQKHKEEKTVDYMG